MGCENYDTTNNYRISHISYLVSLKEASMKTRMTMCALAVMLVLSSAGFAQSEADLAKAVQNPVSSLISLPFQNNTNFNIGPYDRVQNVLNIQPVIPVSLGKWNVINRVIAPFLWQPYDSTEIKFGLSDINYTLFLSPGQPGKIIWGLGPAALFPTATDDRLGYGKWGIGPSIVLLTMPAPWVFGVLVNNIWLIAGDEVRGDINQMLIQYFINYNLPGGWYLATSPIITANWEAESGDQWVIPFGGGFGKIFRVGTQPINAQIQAYYTAIHPENLPYPEWTLRAQLQLMFPK